MLMRRLNNFFLDEPADRYDAEKRLVIAMPKMIKAATGTHLQEQAEQVPLKNANKRNAQIL